MNGQTDSPLLIIAIKIAQTKKVAEVILVVGLLSSLGYQIELMKILQFGAVFIQISHLFQLI
jgi:hypothetical protein